MPSDAVTISVALAAPTAAAVGAVVIHRQRLQHERRQGDLAVVRELLARGAERGMELERATRDWIYAETQAGDPVESVESRAVNAACDGWRTYTANLQVVFPDEHPVIVAAEAIESLAIHVAHDVEAVDLGEGRGNRRDMLPVYSDLETALAAWRLAARTIARAEL